MTGLLWVMAALAGAPEEDRAAAAAATYAAVSAAMASGTGEVEPVYTWSLRWMEAATAATPELALAAAEAHRLRMATLLDDVTRGVEQGMLPGWTLPAAQYYDADARSRLAALQPR